MRHNKPGHYDDQIIRTLEQIQFTKRRMCLICSRYLATCNVTVSSFLPSFLYVRLSVKRICSYHNVTSQHEFLYIQFMYAHLHALDYSLFVSGIIFASLDLTTHFKYCIVCIYGSGFPVCISVNRIPVFLQLSFGYMTYSHILRIFYNLKTLKCYEL